MSWCFKSSFSFKKNIDLKKRSFLRCIVLMSSSRRNLTNSFFCCNVTIKSYINFEFWIFKNLFIICQNDYNYTKYIKYHVVIFIFFYKWWNWFKNLILNETLLKENFRDTTTHNARIFAITLTFNEFIIFSFFWKINNNFVISLLTL